MGSVGRYSKVDLSTLPSTLFLDRSEANEKEYKEMVQSFKQLDSLRKNGSERLKNKWGLS